MGLAGLIGMSETLKSFDELKAALSTKRTYGSENHGINFKAAAKLKEIKAKKLRKAKAC